MNLEQIIERYQQIRQKIKAYHYAMGIISWDSATEAPAGCFEKRAEYSGVLSEMLYTLETSDEYKQLIAQLYEQKDELDPVLDMKSLRSNALMINKIEFLWKSMYPMLH